MDLIRVGDLFDLEHTMAGEYLSQFEYPWEALGGIKAMICRLIGGLPGDEYVRLQEDVFLHKSVKYAASASISGPCIVGEGTEIRPGAFIRGSALIGRNAVVGNSCELKNCILLDGVQVPHFNYVGDSILGYRAHMGAGAVTSNFRGDHQNVVVHGERDIATGLRKFGAMLGDNAEVGCNSVLNPGVIVGRNTQIYPLSSVRGVVPAGRIYKNAGNIVVRRPREE